MSKSDEHGEIGSEATGGIEPLKEPVKLERGPEHRPRLIEGFPKLLPEEAQKERLWTPLEVAKYMNVKLKTVYVWAQNRMIPAYRLGDTLRFRIDEIMAIAKANADDYAANSQKVKKDQSRKDEAPESRPAREEKAV